MLFKQIDLTIDTSKKLEIIDITSKINDLIDIEEGIISVFSKHSTSAIVVNENENGLLDDFEFILKQLVSDKFTYNHDKIDNNASSHLKSFLLGSSECLPIKNYKLDLGTWQSIFFIELDGPRNNRTITLSLIGV
ncbi:secondary thiamine-phosphate synthase enzyme YjbQ [uncultured Methanobrevibacter sp.]|uniref:secondary thiamine-phosphate synthase enzyme YjbQ n=1 Tax=uncultured Methanobrevibacter sp. TaxID=253161 RepID=UPI0025EB8A73|nr:secondary thiamine-phosphate synthase enzyme YjbQ [uncultured Methanobrevibacter sp.]